MKATSHATALVGLLIGVSFLICAGVAVLYHDPLPVKATFFAAGLSAY